MEVQRALVETLIEALANELKRRVPNHCLLEDAVEFLRISRVETFDDTGAHEPHDNLQARGISLVNDLSFLIKQQAESTGGIAHGATKQSQQVA